MSSSNSIEENLSLQSQDSNKSQLDANASENVRNAEATAERRPGEGFGELPANDEAATTDQPLGGHGEGERAAPKPPAVSQIDTPPDEEDKTTSATTLTSSSAASSSLERATNGNTPPQRVIVPQGTVPLQQAAGLVQLPMATQLAMLSYLPQVQAPARAQVPQTASSLDISLLNQLNYFPQLMAGLAPVPQAPLPPSSLQPSLLNQLQLASLARHLAGLPQHVPSQVPMTRASSLPPSYLNQLAAAHTNQHSYLPPTPQASTSALANAYLLQQLSASQNPLQQLSASQNHLQQLSASQNPLQHLSASQNQSQLLLSLIQENRIKDQIVALLLSHQESGVANNNIHTTPQMASYTNQMESLLRSMAANPGSNIGTTSQGAMPVAAVASSAVASSAVASAAVASSYAHQPQLQENISNSPAYGAMPTANLKHAPEASASELASQGHLHAPNQSKLKRWMIRYEELKRFQQKHGHCRVPHGYAENRKLSWWVMNQRAQYRLMRQGKKSWLSEDRVRFLDAICFDWNPIIGKSCKG
eukprot:CAMPEP_0172316748 /NCGR_PEP_ID=MMETSP1058-20130122/29365_1 /TAXON_ID=83371 /ORGANISM="Detonula confervacea, Strain CCMP 353" /LENGTH=532 /DNA_ID=CAMNT_0013031147 /DNA_START=46 /DNA_END=1647 /DNA_ORIENTATION=-